MTHALDDKDNLAFKQLAEADYARKTIKAGDLLNGIVYDAISVTYPTATTETFTYKTGGLSGTTVRVITVTYTDSTKEFISSVERIS